MAKLRNVVRMNRRKLIDDMPRRNDLLLTNPDIFTGIMRNIRPASPIAFFPSFLGNQVGADENDNTMFEAAPQGLGVGFIRLKEYKEVYEPIRVTKNAYVPATIQSQVPFEVSTDFLLERDENFLARDERSYFRVLSSRPTGSGAGADLTVVLDGQPGATASGDLFRYNDPINYNFGNSKGEGSTDSNTFVGDAPQFNTFYNPMKITRRMFSATGSAMGDETEYFAFSMEVEQGVYADYYTDIPISFFEKVVREMSNQFMYSTANFDPATRKIHGMSAVGKYAERPSYAGLYQQLDEVKLIYTHMLRSQSSRQLIATVDEILQKMYYANGAQKVSIVAAGKGAAIAVLRQAIKDSLTSKWGTSISIQTKGDAPVIDVGFELGTYNTDYGTLMLYDMGLGLDQNGEFDKVSFQNITGNPRDWELHFMPAAMRSKNGRMKKPVSIYYRKSSKGGYGDVNRGLVFGKSKGLTGQGSGISLEALQNMQNDSIRQMMQNDKFSMDSAFDGNQYHVLYENVPYIDISKIIKLQIIPS